MTIEFDQPSPNNQAILSGVVNLSTEEDMSGLAFTNANNASTPQLEVEIYMGTWWAKGSSSKGGFVLICPADSPDSFAGYFSYPGNDGYTYPWVGVRTS